MFTAARIAGVHDMILAMPEGYSTRVGVPGQPLSGGQLQRLGLARALFGTPSLIVLDEPDSHLDSEGDTALKYAIEIMRAKGCTVIVMAHSPTALTHMDKVLVLHKGRAVHFGDKEDFFSKAVRAVPFHPEAGGLTRMAASADIPVPKTGLNAPARLGAFASLALLLALGAWLNFAMINGAIIAQGQAVVRGKPKVVQSVQGGLVERIHVTNGDEVAGGDVLLRFDSTLPKVKREIYRQKLAAGLARQARLEAEFAEREEVALPEAPPVAMGDVSFEPYIDGERRTFEARRDVVAGRKEQLLERQLQFENRISGIEAQIAASERQHELISGELEDLQALSDEGLIPESRLLELQRREAELLARVATGRADLAEARNSIRDAKMQSAQAGRSFREGVVTELQQVRAEVDEYILQLAEIDERLARTVVRAPVSGIVHEMQVTTEGGVVGPEQQILKIIPVDEGVEFEVRVDPASIDTVYAGQEVRLRFPAFDQQTVPYVEAEVVSIAPDTVKDPATDRAYYAVGVELAPEGRAKLDGLALVPGMPVNAFLQTRARSVLDYLLAPLTDLIPFAFRES